MQLIAFICCEKVIVDQDSSQISLISLLQGANAFIPVGAEPPSGAAVPFPWTVLSIWNFAKDVIEPPREQFVAFLAPDNEELAKTETSSIQQTSVTHSGGNLIQTVRIINRFPTFPIWKMGLCSVVLNVRQVGASEWQEYARYPFEISYTRPE